MVQRCLQSWPDIFININILSLPPSPSFPRFSLSLSPEVPLCLQISLAAGYDSYPSLLSHLHVLYKPVPHSSASLDLTIGFPTLSFLLGQNPVHP